MVAYKIFLKAYVAAKIVAIEPRLERLNLQRRIAGMIGIPEASGAKALPGYSDRFRLRVGCHLIVYRVDVVRREITIVAVRARKRFSNPVDWTAFDGNAPVADTDADDL